MEKEMYFYKNRLKYCVSLYVYISVVIFTVKPTLIHTDMYVNSIGPVNAINMVRF